MKKAILTGWPFSCFMALIDSGQLCDALALEVQCFTTFLGQHVAALILNHTIEIQAGDALSNARLTHAQAPGRSGNYILGPDRELRFFVVGEMLLKTYVQKNVRFQKNQLDISRNPLPERLDPQWWLQIVRGASFWDQIGN